MSKTLIILDILDKIHVNFTITLLSEENINLFRKRVRKLKLIETLEQEEQLLKELAIIKKTNNEGYFNILSSSLKLTRDKRSHNEI